MFEHQRKASTVAKVLTLCAIGMGIGFGTCGLAFLTSGASAVGSYVAGAGAILFFVSLAGAIITGLYFIISKIVGTLPK